MLELQPKPQFSIVIPPKLLQEGYLVHFSEAYPATFTYVSGKTFRIDDVLQVPFDRGFVVPTGDYRDVDLSNENAPWSESTYPEQQVSLFEIAIGFKPANFLAEFFIPAGKSIHRLEDAQMEPDVTNAVRRFLGAFDHVDSPYDDPRIKVYAVKDFTPLIMRLYAHGPLAPAVGADDEKITIKLIVNKCKLRLIPQPTEEDKRKAKVIRYFDELRW